MPHDAGGVSRPLRRLRSRTHRTVALPPRSVPAIEVAVACSRTAWRASDHLPDLRRRPQWPLDATVTRCVARDGCARHVLPDRSPHHRRHDTCCAAHCRRGSRDWTAHRHAAPDDHGARRPRDLAGHGRCAHRRHHRASPVPAVPAARRVAQHDDVSRPREGRVPAAGWSWGMWDWNWWQRPQADRVAERLTRKASSGDIIVIHDGDHKDPHADRRHAAETVRLLVPRLKARGYTFGTLCG